jgi:hypothetical protein
VDARNSWEKMHESLGEKRKRISDEQLAMRTSEIASSTTLSEYMRTSENTQ